jgi:flagellin
MLNVTTGQQAKSTEKLSSGYKINRAADDAAGLSISEKMRKQMRGLTQASANAQDGISAVQTAEGALAEVHDMLQRMNELAVKAANGTMSSSDRVDVNNEIKSLSTEIDRVATTTKFNEIYLLGAGDEAGTKVDYPASYKKGKAEIPVQDVKFKLQVGADNSDDNMIEVSIQSITAKKLGVEMSSTSVDEPPVAGTGNSTGNLTNGKWEKIGDASGGTIDVLNQDNAKQAIDNISNAIKEVSMRRSNLGAVQNRLEHTIKNLDNVVENTTAAESAIRDTDMATEMVQFSKNNILAQAGQSMLAQANQSNQGVLSLLG